MKKKKDVKPRDYWIAESWRMTGCGPMRNRKKEIPRKAKYSKNEIRGY